MKKYKIIIILSIINYTLNTYSLPVFLAPPASDIRLSDLVINQKAIRQCVDFLNQSAWQESTLFGRSSIIGLWEERKSFAQDLKINKVFSRVNSKHLSAVIAR